MSTVVIATQQWTSWPEYAGSTWVPIQYLIGLGRLGVTAIWVDHLRRMDPRSDVHGVEYLMSRLEATARGLDFEGATASSMTAGDATSGSTGAS